MTTLQPPPAEVAYDRGLFLSMLSNIRRQHENTRFLDECRAGTISPELHRANEHDAKRLDWKGGLYAIITANTGTVPMHVVRVFFIYGGFKKDTFLEALRLAYQHGNDAIFKEIIEHLAVKHRRKYSYIDCERENSYDDLRFCMAGASGIDLAISFSAVKWIMSKPGKRPMPDAEITQGWFLVMRLAKNTENARWAQMHQRAKHLFLRIACTKNDAARVEQFIKDGADPAECSYYCVVHAVIHNRAEVLAVLHAHEATVVRAMACLATKPVPTPSVRPTQSTQSTQSVLAPSSTLAPSTSIVLVEPPPARDPEPISPFCLVM